MHAIPFRLDLRHIDLSSRGTTPTDLPSSTSHGNQVQTPNRPKEPRKTKSWFQQARRFTAYNPLDLDNLGRSVELELLARDPEPLGNVVLMYGSGIYALYYTGPHELYAPISQENCEVPIYVGQARPKGTRKGIADESADSTALWDRIKDHRSSIQQACDLEVEDFMVRHLVAIEAFVSLAERVMIRHHHPVWNSVVDGFGNHDPGADRRKTGKRPPWDELHPGRWWSHPANMPAPSLVSAETSKERVRALFGGNLSAEDLARIEAERL
ncbi:Eco29kI family restriction endonuclease [Actinomadura parmotrematis]|uniref:Eco29kI family restriction endonuclease n=1 Tax=Actinomadura parmotrematis TaxID=2864039 RepID=A0ABS7FND7_9ACTN|nr:Eco29kI family restriction endonuclease [Actinomadura parmotrematis]